MTRFDFGKNWSRYLRKINEERIAIAMRSISDMLRLDNLNNKTFLDVGCGSGLFSLAALKLGAVEVFSFDYDKYSVECAEFLNQKYGPYDNWSITQGSALDKKWLSGLGKYDVVYSWGVLHHTGDMWRAMENVCELVKPKGLLFLSIYNDRGLISRMWRIIKLIYNKSPFIVKMLIAVPYYILMLINEIISIIINKKPLKAMFKDQNRGMTLWYDCLDWCGGYPFETATPEKILDYFYHKGFYLVNMRLKRGSGCNEFVFTCSRDVS